MSVRTVEAPSVGTGSRGRIAGIIPVIGSHGEGTVLLEYNQV